MTSPKFYQLSKTERLARLVKGQQLSEKDAQFLAQSQPLADELAASLIENYIGQYHLPLGIVQDVMVDGKVYQVPMAIEEPSVIAAANNAAKMIRLNGGVTIENSQRVMFGEVVLTDLPQLADAVKWVDNHFAILQAVAQKAHPSIVKRGGGLQKIATTIVENRFLKLNLEIDTKAAMGANIVNTICEAIAHAVQATLGGTILLSVLTNAAFGSVVKASVTLNSETLATATLTGEAVAQRLIDATQFAQFDVARAATHNKGIMNGIDAVIMATGNDWRAIEAGAHSYAAHTGHYQPLTAWSWTTDQQLRGQIAVPLSVGIVGGSIGILPTVQVAQRLLAIETAEELAGVIAAIGLGQNLAALKALVSDGIQKGHMALQAKSLAIAVGATASELTILLPRLLKAPHLNTETATTLLSQIRTENR